MFNTSPKYIRLARFIAVFNQDSMFCRYASVLSHNSLRLKPSQSLHYKSSCTSSSTLHSKNGKCRQGSCSWAVVSSVERFHRLPSSTARNLRKRPRPLSYMAFVTSPGKYWKALMMLINKELKLPCQYRDLNAVLQLCFSARFRLTL